MECVNEEVNKAGSTDEPMSADDLLREKLETDAWIETSKGDLLRCPGHGGHEDREVRK
jgi:hypothetical protein